MKIYKSIISPAIYPVKATGLEKKKCLLCDKKFTKDEKIVELYSSTFRGKNNHSNRFHRKCFLKIMALNFPEILNEDCFDKEFKSEILISKVEDE